MRLDELVRLFDNTAVEEGKVAFTLHAPKTGKWNFWSAPDLPRTKEDIAEDIMKIEDLASVEISGFEDVALEPWDEDGLRIRIWVDDCETDS